MDNAHVNFLNMKSLFLIYQKYDNLFNLKFHRDGYEGDPFVRCTLNPCLTSPCGVNAECKPGEIFNSSFLLKKILTKIFLGGQRAVCECRDGYEGDPFVR